MNKFQLEISADNETWTCDIDHAALIRQNEIASRLSKHLEDKDYQVFQGLLNLMDKMLMAMHEMTP